VRRFLVRLTLVSATSAAVIAALVGAANRAPWPLVLTRASIAFLIVLTFGFLASLILMRTALRRYYEHSQRESELESVRADR